MKYYKFKLKLSDSSVYFKEAEATVNHAKCLFDKHCETMASVLEWLSRAKIGETYSHTAFTITVID
jgi:hypothetical protein